MPVAPTGVASGNGLGAGVVHIRDTVPGSIVLAAGSTPGSEVHKIIIVCSTHKPSCCLYDNILYCRYCYTSLTDI